MSTRLIILLAVSAVACTGGVDGFTPPDGDDDNIGGDDVLIGDPIGGDNGDSGPATTTALARTTNTSCSLGALPGTTNVFPGIASSSLTGMVPVPGGNGRVALSVQKGIVKVFDAHNFDIGTVQVALDIQTKVTDLESGEKGFHSIAFAPDFDTSGHLYVMYSIHNPAPAPNDDGDSRVERYTCTRDNGLTCDPSSADPIITIERPDAYTNHNGGQIFFDANGYLFISMGDSASGGDPSGWAQDLTKTGGKLLRIDPSHGDGTNNYSIPADNPYATTGGNVRHEIYAYGFRNPWRVSLDAPSGRIFVADVGQGQWEEIDILESGKDYGWNILEGTHPYGGSDGVCDGCIPPIYEYDHENGRLAITGGYVYHGTANPSLEGAYIFADYGTGEIWRLDEDDSHLWTSTPLFDTGSPLTSFGLDDQGEIYALHYNGTVQRIDVDIGDDSTVPRTLSDTGCYSDVPGHVVANGIVPYDIRVPFWSDGETKKRYVLVPGGATIDATLADAWSFPIGTIFIKEFEADGGPTETRFLVHADADTWKGFSYRWNADKTDADLQPDEEQTFDYMLNGQAHQHVFPSRSECNQCHTSNGGFILGFRTQQLNMAHDYGSGSENQVEAFGIAGFLTERLSGQASDWPALAKSDDTTVSVGPRARSYLAANCSQCHSGTDNGGRFPDMRFATALADTKLCSGVSGGPDITPGDAEHSTIILKDGTRGAGQMPPLATLVPDTAGVQLVSDWINAMTDDPATLDAQYICPPN